MKQIDLQNLNIVENLELLSKIKPEKMLQLIHFLENFGYDVEKNINLQSNTREVNPKTGSVYVINLNLDDGISHKDKKEIVESCCE